MQNDVKNQKMLINFVQVDTASVDCGLENSEEEKCDVTATGDSCLAASAHDDVMETANEDDENGVDTKEDASPERQPTHPVVVRRLSKSIEKSGC